MWQQLHRGPIIVIAIVITLALAWFLMVMLKE
jgi:hypothetical protein